MRMIVFFSFMGRMNMVVRPMVSLMIMVVHVLVSSMVMLMRMLVFMFMDVGV